MLGKCLNRLYGSFSRRTYFFVKKRPPQKLIGFIRGKLWKLGVSPFFAYQDLPFSSSSTLMVNDWLSFLECKGLTYTIIPGTSSTLTQVNLGESHRELAKIAHTESISSCIYFCFPISFKKKQRLFFFFFFLNFIYLFTFGCSGSSLAVAASGGTLELRCMGFSMQWLLCCGAWVLKRSGFSS